MKKKPTTKSQIRNKSKGDLIAKIIGYLLLSIPVLIILLFLILTEPIVSRTMMLRFITTCSHPFSAIVTGLFFLIFGQIVAACFWKRARKWKLLLTYVTFGIILFICGKIYDYTIREDVARHRVILENFDCCLHDPEYKGKSCQSQIDCGGTTWGFFCDYKGEGETGICERVKETGNYSLSFKSAQNWCESRDKKLYNPYNKESICNELKTGNYWLSDGHILNAEKCVIETKNPPVVANVICKHKIENERCSSQNDCGGSDSRYFCNFKGREKTGICENAGEGLYVRQDNAKNYWKKTDDTLLSFKSAQNWCESKGKKLFNYHNFHKVSFKEIRNGYYWLSNGGRVNPERAHEVIISENPEIVANVLCKDKIEDEDCKSQSDCGGSNSHYFCNYVDSEMKGICERVGDSLYFKQENGSFYRVKMGGPRLSFFKAAQNWCESRGMELYVYDTHNIQKLFSSVLEYDARPLDEVLDTGYYWISGEQTLFLDRMDYGFFKTSSIRQRGYYINKVSPYRKSYKENLVFPDVSYGQGWNRAICQEIKK